MRKVSIAEAIHCHGNATASHGTKVTKIRSKRVNEADLWLGSIPLPAGLSYRSEITSRLSETNASGASFSRECSPGVTEIASERSGMCVLVLHMAQQSPRLHANKVLAFFVVEINGDQLFTDVVSAAGTP